MVLENPEAPKRKAAIAPDGTLQYTSVSAIGKHMQCPSAWYLRYKLRMPDSQGKGAKESEECHGRTEHYLKTGENVLGTIERRALALGLFPTPNDPKNPRPDDLLLEYPLETYLPVDAAGVPLVGKIDCVDPRRIEAEGVVVLNDWKFKKNIVAYGASERDLIDPTKGEGVQMLGYGEAVRRAKVAGHPLFAKVDAVVLRHVEVEKDPANIRRPEDGAREVYVVCDVEFFGEVWAEVERRHVEPMKAAALEPSVATVAHNPAACFSFGRECPFAAACPHRHSTKPADKMARWAAMLTQSTPRGVDPSQKEGTKMGMLSKKINTPATPPPSVVTPPTAAPAAAPAAPKAPSIIVDLSTVPDEVLKVAKAVHDSHERLGLKPHAETEAVLAAAVLPPDAPKSAGVAAQNPPVHVAERQAEPIQTESAKAGRKPRAKKPDAAEPEKVPFNDPAIDKVAEAIRPMVEGFRLFVGCSSRKYPAAPFTPYVEKIERLALDNFRTQLGLEVSDIRLSSGDAVGFGKWKPVLAALAKENPPEPGNYNVLGLGIDDRIDVIVGALESLAADVVVR